MDIGTFRIIEKKVIVHLRNRTCETADELFASDLFREIIQRGIRRLAHRKALVMTVFDKDEVTDDDIQALIETIKFLAKMPASLVPNVVPAAKTFLREPVVFNELVENLYNFWRSFDRFVISESAGMDLDQRPYRTFNSSIGQLTNLIRGMYRDVQENITGRHPRVYRQVAAGAEVSSISVRHQIPFADARYDQLNRVAMIRQILLYPPLILDPPMNKRTGKFERVDSNPLDRVDLQAGDWLCYPAKVGALVILIYFHNKFSDLGHSLCNLFELADDEDLKRRPDAVYLYGVPGEVLDDYGVFPTVFYEDDANDLLVGAVPGRDEFGYFGYLKKMVLTLHNIIMMKRDRMPYHGALIRLILKGGRDISMLLIGDTGAGKSETLEAMRALQEEYIQDLIIIADDMGSLDIDPTGRILGYGTEIGAFLRLDDLQAGYALGQIDRAIIMSPNKVNARIVIPVTSYENIMRGTQVDYVFYANNYEDIDEDHPLIERLSSVDHALQVFKEGTVMSKGTTTSKGIVHSYFANVFGPPQCRDRHDRIARRYFEAFYAKGLFVGQIRTRLGLPGWEKSGPEALAKALLEIFLA